MAMSLYHMKKRTHHGLYIFTDLNCDEAQINFTRLSCIPRYMLR